jgi:hypothetical protein
MTIATAMPPGGCGVRHIARWGFIRSPLMPPMGVCLRRIVPAEAMVVVVVVVIVE